MIQPARFPGLVCGVKVRKVRSGGFEGKGTLGRRHARHTRRHSSASTSPAPAAAPSRSPPPPAAAAKLATALALRTTDRHALDAVAPAPDVASSVQSDTAVDFLLPALASAPAFLSESISAAAMRASMSAASLAAPPLPARTPPLPSVRTRVSNPCTAAAAAAGATEAAVRGSSASKLRRSGVRSCVHTSAAAADVFSPALPTRFRV
jgi:hypothetical protein